MSNSALSYQNWLQQAIQQLCVIETVPDAKIDAQMLLQFVTQKSSAQLMAFAETLLSVEQLQILNQFVQRRLQGEPIAYIVGEKGFWTLDLAVSDKTLIPRPDTECLVETALALIAQQFTAEEKLAILDLGTGTGAIALALAYELQQQNRTYQILGVDRIVEAVELAKQNAARNQLSQVEFIQSNWFAALSKNKKFDLIVSNPPYIAKDDPHLQQGDVRFEPLSALVAENDGLADIEHIIQTASEFIQQQGWLLIEHGWQQAEIVQTLFQQYHWQNVQTIKDYGGNQRVTFAQWNG
ncbi:peptide chain release factor N(5)-glutamine methyltransferase [Gallibacterium trehalosifermentans]|uniref:Release factor glutamine methyltransferase n=1 Tax=Gallibacterium trehalosifermentans TaxID=516935 RepID=A0ABV6GY71_9PAST